MHTLVPMCSESAVFWSKKSSRCHGWFKITPC